MTVAKFKTQYGPIYVSSPGPFKDPPYKNVNVYAQTNVRHVVLQGPALRAFRAAEARVATKKRPHILITGVGYRSYRTQAALYATDHQRYADPDGSMHVEALAIDIDQNQGSVFKPLSRINAALRAEGFNFAVSGEPWHASFRVSG